MKSNHSGGGLTGIMHAQSHKPSSRSIHVYAQAHTPTWRGACCYTHSSMQTLGTLRQTHPSTPSESLWDWEKRYVIWRPEQSMSPHYKALASSTAGVAGAPPGPHVGIRELSRYSLDLVSPRGKPLPSSTHTPNVNCSPPAGYETLRRLFPISKLL